MKPLPSLDSTAPTEGPALYFHLELHSLQAGGCLGEVSSLALTPSCLPSGHLTYLPHHLTPYARGVAAGSRPLPLVGP